VLLAVKVRTPLPALVSAPVPVTGVAKLTLLQLVSKVPPPAPSGASREEMSSVLPVAHCRPPPFKVIAPVPKLLAAMKFIRPPDTVVPPV
jgi:hypothetical protein